MKPHEEAAWWAGQRLFFSSHRAPLWFTDQICVPKDPDRGEYPFMFPGSHQAPTPTFPLQCPIQINLSSHRSRTSRRPWICGARGSDSLRRHWKSSWQALFWSFTSQMLSCGSYTTLRGRAGLMSSACISSVGDSNIIIF